MKNIVTSVFQTIKVICFWGLLYLLLLMIGFKVELNDIWNSFVSGQTNIKIVSGFLLLGPVMYIIIAIVQLIYSATEGEAFFHLAISMWPNFWPPYKMLSFRNDEKTVYYIIQAILWWGVTIFSVLTICNVEGNLILLRINCFEGNQVLERIGLFLGACLIGNIVSYLVALIAARFS